jgi:hypothetical protein
VAFNTVVPESEIKNRGSKPKDKFFLHDDNLIGKLTGLIPVYKLPKTDLDSEMRKLHQIDFKSNVETENDEIKRMNSIFAKNDRKRILDEIHSIRDKEFELSKKETLPDYAKSGGRRES